MAELKNTVVSGSLAARGVYENGTALENKYGASLALSSNTIQLKDYKGNVISSVTLPTGTCTVAGGGLSKGTASGGGLSGGGLSGGGLTITTNYSGTPTVTLSTGSETNMTNITVGSKDTTNYPYYFKVNGSSSSLSGKTKATRAAVTRAKIDRAAFSQTVTRAAVTDAHSAGWISAKSATTVISQETSTVSLAAGSIAADSTTIAAASVEPTVTINAGSGSTYVGLKAATITVNTPTVTPTHGAVTPSIGGTITGVATTTQPSGTDGTDYLTIDPGASITTQPKATPTYTYSATAGYTPAVSSTTKTGSATNITPSISAGTSYYLPKKTPSFDGGGLTVPNPTVTLEKGETTNNSSGVNITSSITDNGTTEPTSGYYVAIKGTASAITATRAATLYNGAVNGWVNIADNTTALAKTTKSNSAASATEYFKIPTGSCTVAGGGLSSGSGSVSLSTNISVTEESEQPTEGYYLKVSGSGSITRAAVTDTHTAGYIPAKSATTVISEASKSSNTAVEYYSIPSGLVGLNATKGAGSVSVTGTNITITEATSQPTSGYYITATGSGSGTVSSTLIEGYISGGTGPSKSVTSNPATKYYTIDNSTITANTPTVNPTHGAVTPSVGGTVTSVATTTKPSGTDGTDYLTIDPGASITTQPKATPTYTYSATAGYTPAVSSTTKTGSATNITPSVNAGTNYYLPKKTPSFDGGGLTVPNPTVTLAKGGDTDGTGNITSKLTDNGTTEPTSGYYFSIKGSASAITATRAATLYNGAVNGWVNVADNTTALSSTTKSNSAVSATEYFKIPSATLTLSAFASGSVREFTIADDGTVTCYADITGEASYDDFDTGWLGSAPASTTYDATTSLSGSVATTSVTPSASLATLTSAGSSATTVNSRYFKVTPSYSAANKGWLATTSGNGTVKNYTVKSGSATTPTASGASTSTSLSGTTLTVARSVTPTVSAGWVSSGTAGTVTITGTVPTETKTVTPSSSSQTIKPASGKLLSQVTVNAVSATTGNEILYHSPGTETEGDLMAPGEMGFVVRRISTSSISDPTSVSGCSCRTFSFQIGPYYIKEVLVTATGSHGSFWRITFGGTTYSGMILGTDITPDPGE